MGALKDYRVPFTELVTNGTLLDEEKITAMLQARLSRLVVSIDGATAATYESIRVGANFERLIHNLRLLQRMKTEQRRSRPLLRFNFVMMRRNIEELPSLIQLADQLGAKQVTAQHMTIYDARSRDQSLFQHQEVTNRCLLDAHRLAAERGITFNAPALFSVGSPSPADRAWLVRSRMVTGFGVLRDFGPRRLLTLAGNLLQRRTIHRNVWCHHPWEIVFLDPHAYVRPCVSWGSEPVLGNCLEQSLEEIFEGPTYTQLRGELTGRLPKCEVCLHCPALSSGKVDEPTAFEERAT